MFNKHIVFASDLGFDLITLGQDHSITPGHKLLMCILLVSNASPLESYDPGQTKHKNGLTDDLSLAK